MKSGIRIPYYLILMSVFFCESSVSRNHQEQRRRIYLLYRFIQWRLDSNVCWWKLHMKAYSCLTERVAFRLFLLSVDSDLNPIWHISSFAFFCTTTFLIRNIRRPCSFTKSCSLSLFKHKYGRNNISINRRHETQHV